MACYTAAKCYRAGGDPPIVTGADLAAFCTRVRDMGVLNPDISWGVMVKYGHAIDQDIQPTVWKRQVTATISQTQFLDWDVYRHPISPTKAVQLLNARPEPRRRNFWDALRRKSASPSHIYRAHLDMAWLRSEYTTTIGYDFEDVFLSLSELTFNIDIVKIHDSNTMNCFWLGWMSFSVGGHVDPFPWTYEETLQRVREHPQLHAIREICREMWPASNDEVDQEVRDERALMGRYWAEPLDAPNDSYWVIDGYV